MKILFTNEFWPPVAPGGAEWSSELHAEALIRAGHRVVVVTPGYGYRSATVRGLDIRRFWYPWRPGFLTFHNPLMWVYSAWWIWKAGHMDIIHVQGKGLLIGSWLVARLRRIPVIATIRDLSYLCPLGMCYVADLKEKQ